MQLQFDKTVIPCLKTIKREFQSQEQTQEVRLTDGMPDIGSVLGCWGQPVIRGKEWHTGSAGVSGGVMAWVLYAPEDGGEPQCVETWLPFQMKWDLPDIQRDGTVNVMPVLRNMDARSLSARKLMVRANMGVLGELLGAEDAEVFLPGEMPAHIQVLKNTYPMRIPAEAGEKAFLLEEVLTLPSTVPAISKLLRYTVHPVLVEYKVVTDKLVIRGVVTLRILYMGVDSRIHLWDFELPFSQYAELDREYDAGAEARIHFAVTGLELDRGEEETLNLKAGITAQYVVYQNMMVSVAEDMYSTRQVVEPQYGNLQVPAMLDMMEQTALAEQKLDNGVTDIADVVFYPDQPVLRRDGDKITAELTGIFQTLGYDAEGNEQSAIARWEGEISLDAGEGSQVDMWLMPASRPAVVQGADGFMMRAEMPVQVRTGVGQGITMLTGAELGEAAVPSEDRPSLILRRAGEGSLWDIAKAAGSTVDAIKKANQLEREPDSGKMLLIPLA